MDGYGWQSLGLVTATLAASWCLDWVVRFWRNSKQEQRQQEAEKTLRAHGLQSRVYLASFACESEELRKALEAYDFSNRLVLDADGNLVGGVLPSMKASGPSLRLVVDNTKSKQ